MFRSVDDAMNANTAQFHKIWNGPDQADCGTVLLWSLFGELRHWQLCGEGRKCIGRQCRGVAGASVVFSDDAAISSEMFAP